MPVLWVDSEGGRVRIPFLPGRTLRDILYDHAIPIVSVCAGAGTCGGCRVRVESGFPHPATPAECCRLSREELDAGIRLACQVRPSADLGISIPPEVARPATTWSPLTEPAGRSVHSGRAPGSPTGAAVDIGTTHLRIGLCDVANRVGLARRIGLNPQAAYGADVLARLDAARSRARELSTSVVEAIGSGLREVLAAAGTGTRAPGRLVLVGNSAMLLMLSGRDPEELLDPDRWQDAASWGQPDTAEWRRQWGLDEGAAVALVPPVAGFVGSDLLASAVATRLLDGPAGSLLIDFGTNSEIALWDGTTLWVTSAAGGPAFESSGISCGVPAGPGAICRVARARGDSNPFQLEVTGGGPGRGLGGPGLVDAVACLLEAQLLFRGGHFTAGTPRDGIVIQAAPHRVVLTKRDVDTFQRAKAAIAAAVELLLERADLGVRDLRRLCVCGALGDGLRLGAAQAVGLLPPAPVAAVEFCPTAALDGAEGLLLDPDGEARADRCRRRAHVVNLAAEARYDERFVANLRLSPMS